MDFVGSAIKLSNNDILETSQDLGCEFEVIEAVRDIESGGSGFLPDGRPKILFEAHIFGKLTKHEFDDSNPNISSDYWDRDLYGPGGAHQYDRLKEAIDLDRRAALNSASWGMFQILGLNDGQCGYKDVEDFVKDMMESEGKQLDIFEKFCINGGLVKYLRNKDWTRFALRYNGSGQAANQYDVKLENAYWRHKGHDHVVLPSNTDAPFLIGFDLLFKECKGEKVKELQNLLKIEPDGVFGKQTDLAVRKFQSDHNLIVDGIVGSRTLAVLRGN